MGVIYGLFDPRKPIELPNCRYFGQTKQSLTNRLIGLKDEARRGHRDVSIWIRIIRSEGVDPVVRLVELIDKGDQLALDNAERNWIAVGRSRGWHLLNMNDGGTGQSLGFKYTDEQRRRMSEIILQMHIDDPGIAERKREGQMRRFENPAEREAMSIAASEWIASLDKSDRYCPDCGKGPYVGVWGLSNHRGYDHDPQPEMCPDCGGGPFRGTAGVARHRMHKHQDKDELMCDCGAGPFRGNHGLGIHKSRFCKLVR